MHILYLVMAIFFFGPVMMALYIVAWVHPGTEPDKLGYKILGGCLAASVIFGASAYVTWP